MILSVTALVSEQTVTLTRKGGMITIHKNDTTTRRFGIDDPLKMLMWIDPELDYDQPNPPKEILDLIKYLNLFRD